MDAQSNSKNQFDNWCDMWQQAQETDLFNDAPISQDPYHPSNQSPDKQDFFGQNHEEAEEEIPTSAVDYWNMIYKMSNNAGDSPDVTKFQVLTEEEDKVVMPEPVKPNQMDAERGAVVKSKASAANPINPSSVGKDQDYKPSLVNVYQLEQLHDMKINLHELEAKLNANDALGKTKEGAKVQKQIDEMKKKIDELSDALTPNFLQSYLS